MNKVLGRNGREIQDLTGCRYSRLVVLETCISSNNRTQWKCLCDCGKLTVTSVSNLKRGKTRSCGCIRTETSKVSIQRIVGWGRKPHGEAAVNALYSSYRSEARDNEVPFEITVDQFKLLVTGKCYYCGRIPHRYTTYGGNGNVLVGGIDRKYRELGYTIDNIVSCCKDCNYSKNVLNPEEFLEHVSRIYKHSIMGGR